MRIDLREKIFREVVANLLIHREYTNAHIASIIIYQDRVELLNANKPYYHGKIDIKNFHPYPKNPLISKFFTQLGRVEEIGSGILNVTKYLKYYLPGAEAEFIDGDIFKAIIPIPVREKELIATEKFELGQFETIEEAMNGLKKFGIADGGISDGIGDTMKDIITDVVTDTINNALNYTVSDEVKIRLIDELIFIIFNKEVKLNELKSKFNLTQRTVERDIKLLKEIGFVEFSGARKTGHYLITDKLKKLQLKRR